MPDKNGIDRLELLVNADLEISTLKVKLKAVQNELAKHKSELKKLQAIDPGLRCKQPTRVNSSWDNHFLGLCRKVSI